MAGVPVGSTVAGLGDTSGDGIPDVLVAGQYDDRTFVIFGRRPPVNVNLAALGSAGYRVFDGSVVEVPGRPTSFAATAWGAAGLADVNGDGRRDIAVGSGSALGIDGRAAVIFGAASTAPVDFAALGSRGYKIEPQVDQVESAGDPDGDGRGDLLVQPSRPLLVFGKPSTGTVDMRALGAQGVAFTGLSDGFGWKPFSAAGDVTGDGDGDLLFRADGDFQAQPPTPSRTYVLSLHPRPLDRLFRLTERIRGFGLTADVQHQLLLRTRNIRRALLAGHEGAACLRLSRLARLAGRLNGQGLPPAAAFEVVAATGFMRTSLGC